MYYHVKNNLSKSVRYTNLGSIEFSKQNYNTRVNEVLGNTFCWILFLLSPLLLIFLLLVRYIKNLPHVIVTSIKEKIKHFT